MPDLFLRRIGGDVEVLRHQTSQQVAHGTADDVGLIAALLQGLDGPLTATTDLLPLQTVLDERRSPPVEWNWRCLFVRGRGI
jgi:hypothetical protein